jgi:predicted secreted protein
MRKPDTNGTRGKKGGELLEAAGLNDKTGVWSSLPASSRLNVIMVGSRMMVKDETTQTQVVKPFVWESPLSSAWGQHHPPLGLVAGGRFIVVATELGGGEAHKRVNDFEPRWLFLHIPCVLWRPHKMRH